jgi:erythronate-4-phosphate dehydrogenase
VAHAVGDTWEGEPVYRPDLLRRADIGTPHIAGHSFEGKVMGTVLVYREVCKFLGVPATWSPDNLLPPSLVPELEIDAAGRRDEAVLWQLVRPVYDIEADDKRLRQGADLDDKARGVHFDGLRKNYPMRREFPFTRVILRNGSGTLKKKIERLGFTVTDIA